MQMIAKNIDKINHDVTNDDYDRLVYVIVNWQKIINADGIWFVLSVRFLAVFDSVSPFRFSQEMEGK